MTSEKMTPQQQEQIDQFTRELARIFRRIKRQSKTEPKKENGQ